jgi:hypothetical protein
MVTLNWNWVVNIAGICSYSYCSNKHFTKKTNTLFTGITRVEDKFILKNANGSF